MKKAPTPESQTLRQKAEAMLKTRRDDVRNVSADADTLKLIHELEVHQIELELQNGELLLAKQQAELAAEKYTSLYDFAPSGYFTLSADGEIIELNLAGARMLGKERSRLKNSLFGFFVSGETRPAFDHFLAEAFRGTASVTCEVTLTLNGGISIVVSLTGALDESGKRCLLSAVVISEQRKMELLLQENYAKLQVTIDDAPVCIAMVGLDKHFLNCNKAFCHLLGYTEEEMKGKTIADITFPEDMMIGMDDLRAILAGEKESSHVTKRYVCNDGNVVWGDVNIRLIRNLDGKPLYFLPIIQDITAVRQAEVSLRNSESTFRNMIENTPFGMHFYEYIQRDDRLVFTGSNPAADTILGVDNSQFIGKTITEAFPPLAKTEVPQRYKDAAKNNVVWSTEQISYKDASVEGAFEIRAFQTVPGKMVTIFMDITERKQAEEALAESEKKYRALFETMSEGIVYEDHDGKIISANPAAERLLGLSLDQMQGRTSLDRRWKAIHEDGSPFPGETHSLHIAAKTGKPATGEIMGIYNPKSGANIWLSVNSTPEFLPGEKLPFRAYAVFRDITERRLSDAKIRQINDQLTELNATKDKFFNIIAHDLKSPFNSIVGFSDLLMELASGNDYSQVGKYAGIIHQSSHRAIDLLMNLTEWARSQTGRIEFNPEIFEMDELINDVVKLLSDNAAQKRITISKTSPSSGIAKADKAMISTVLRNLVANAIKFTKPGGEIILSVSENNSGLTVAVKDNGIGIPAHLTGKLFRLDGSFTTRGTEKEQGTGLGLILCKEFIEKHNGTISFESTEGKGSTFSFTLPG